MSVSDTIAVINEGRIEQVGPPRLLYDRPANRFVMGFLGPVTRLRGRFVRPHDVAIAGAANGTGDEATVTRVVHLGFEVRVELVLDGGEPASVQLARSEADQLELSEGDRVSVRVTRAPAISP